MDSSPGIVQVDPVTGRPVEALKAEQAEQDRRQEEALLRDQAAWMAVSRTEAGAKLLTMVTQQLTRRIEALVKEDPEAGAYAAILQEMGVKEGLARAAAQQLFKRYVKEDT